MTDFTATSFSTKHRRPLAGLDRVLALLAELTPLHEGAVAGGLTGQLAVVVGQVGRLRDRLDSGPGAPLIAAVMGATGTGKSKLFNTLLGQALSPSGYRRPTTMAPIMFIPAGHREFVLRPEFLPEYEKRLSETLPVEFKPGAVHEIVLVPTATPWHENLILIDTPDFDSVLSANRTAARAVFERCDVVIFVTDAVKYADQAAWEYLDLIRDGNKEAVLLVNRLKNPLSRQDFLSRLRAAGLDRPVPSLPDEPGLGDEDLFPADRPALTEIRQALADWSGPKRVDILAAEAGRAWSQLDQALTGILLPSLSRTTADLSTLQEHLTRAGQEINDDLGRQLAVTISGELKSSLILQIQTLFLKWDVLRYPRRVIGLPYALLRDKVLQPLGLMKGSGKNQGGLEQEINRLFEANREKLVASIYEFNSIAADLLASKPVGQGLMNRPEFSALVRSGDQVRNAYGQVRAELEDWVKQQAQELVKGLDLGEKMTFYMAQIVSLGLFISIQVHTGGGFSFFDGLLDSVLAPILSKVTGHALSRDKVKAFEIKAAQIHLEGCQGVVAGQVKAYTDYLNLAQKGLATAKPLAEAVRDLEREFEAWP
jgi:hypothetical protein